jgi:hypothetical protein
MATDAVWPEIAQWHEVSTAGGSRWVAPFFIVHADVVRFDNGSNIRIVIRH